MSNDWIEWVYTPEKPYPETLDTLVQVKFRDGDEFETGFTVEHWHFLLFSKPEASNWHQNGSDAEIIAYKVCG